MPLSVLRAPLSSTLVHRLILGGKKPGESAWVSAAGEAAAWATVVSTAHRAVNTNGPEFSPIECGAGGFSVHMDAVDASHAALESWDPATYLSITFSAHSPLMGTYLRFCHFRVPF